MSDPSGSLLAAVVGGRYRLVQLLASGGTSEVYLADDTRDGARVAVKVLRAEHRGSRSLVDRFRREARALARVRHQNVIALRGDPFDEAEHLGFPLELLVGLDLADTLANAGALDPTRAVGIAIGAARGLAAAHAVGVAHGDLRPENIFLVHSADGAEAVKLIDFGASGAAVLRDDVRALGAVIGEMVTGTRPSTVVASDEASAFATLASAALGRVVRRMLEGGGSIEAVLEDLVATPEAAAIVHRSARGRRRPTVT